MMPLDKKGVLSRRQFRSPKSSRINFCIYFFPTDQKFVKIFTPYQDKYTKDESMSDDGRYESLQAKQYEEWEARCRGCGACCGATEQDPCEHLYQTAPHKFTCRIYENRFGLHHTRSGREFCCVPIRQILHKHWLGSEQCAYRKVSTRGC